jgi:uncharacterized protein (DUF2235 family)
MSKRIAFCADGTWDKPANKTNVYKLYKSILVTADQMPLYDDGVGANGLPVDKLLGGAFGAGLFQKIKDGYTKIAQLYEAGDPLYLFGFSRGAYTARSLAGMIAICGLPTKSFTDDLVETAFNAYRNKDQRAELLAKLDGFSMFDAKMTMVGVWETVGSLGIPAAIGLSDPLVYGFLDTSLHPDVLNAYQAMAIDEKRVEFPVTQWTNPPALGQTVEQVWFTGVHSDVGGGEPDDATAVSALSDITLGWIMNKAIGLGLTIDPTEAEKYKVPLDPKDALDKLHTSWNILWGFPKHRPVTATATLANSVAIRCANDQTYRPPNLKLPVNQYATAEVVGPPPAEVEMVLGAGG